MEEKHIGTAKVKTYIQITRITIVICWISLFAFWAIKLFGGNFFEVVVENKNFIKFSETVQNSWLKYLVSFITIALSNYMTLGAVCQKFYFKGKQSIVIWFSIITMWVVANFIEIDFLKMWYGYILTFLIPLFYQIKYKKLLGLLAVVFDLGFSIISMLVRNIPLVVSSNYMISMIMSIDIYIMICLYYLYSNLINMKRRI